MERSFISSEFKALHDGREGRIDTQLAFSAGSYGTGLSDSGGFTSVEDLKADEIHQIVMLPW